MGALVGTKAEVVDLDSGDRYLPDRAINHLAASDDGWWAVDDESGVWHGEERVARSDDATFHCLTVDSQGLWLGANSARLFRLNTDGLTEDFAFADAPGRDTWHTPWGGPPDVRSLAFGPDGFLFVNVHVGGILVYDNTGLTPTVDIDADVHQVLAHPDRPGTVLAATAWGLAVATNGHDFDFVTSGLPHRYCRAVTVDDGTVLVSASRGPGGGDAALYRGELGDGSLRRCSDGLPDSFQGNLDTHCLAAGDQGFVAGNGTSAWGSDDGGQSWRQIASDLPQVTCVIALDEEPVPATEAFPPFPTGL